MTEAIDWKARALASEAREAALRERVEGVEAALRRFADRAEIWDHDDDWEGAPWPDDTFLVVSDPEDTYAIDDLTIGDFRAARAALSPAQARPSRGGGVMEIEPIIVGYENMGPEGEQSAAIAHLCRLLRATAQERDAARVDRQHWLDEYKHRTDELQAAESRAAAAEAWRPALLKINELATEFTVAASDHDDVEELLGKICSAARTALFDPALPAAAPDQQKGGA